MNVKKIAKLVAIIVVGVVIIGGIGIGISGYWPVAIVDKTPITYNMFKENFMMADHFYRSRIKISGEDDQVIMAKEVQQDLQRVTMEGLIEGILIDRELAKRYASNDLEQLIENKLNEVDLDVPNMGKATELLYGLTPNEFKELVLVPKAKQEILEGNLTLQSDTFNDWLSTKESEASVSVFVPSLYWNENAVGVK